MRLTIILTLLAAGCVRTVPVAWSPATRAANVVVNYHPGDNEPGDCIEEGYREDGVRVWRFAGREDAEHYRIRKCNENLCTRQSGFFTCKSIHCGFAERICAEVEKQ